MTTLKIEQFDNGITLKSEDSEGNISAVVVPDAHVKAEIGNGVWADIQNLMNGEACNKVKVTIEYEPIKEE